MLLGTQETFGKNGGSAQPTVMFVRLNRFFFKTALLILEKNWLCQQHI